MTTTSGTSVCDNSLRSINNNLLQIQFKNHAIYAWKQAYRIHQLLDLTQHRSFCVDRLCVSYFVCMPLAALRKLCVFVT